MLNHSFRGLQNPLSFELVGGGDGSALGGRCCNIAQDMHVCWLTVISDIADFHVNMHIHFGAILFRTMFVVHIRMLSWIFQAPGRRPCELSYQ